MKPNNFAEEHAIYIF